MSDIKSVKLIGVAEPLVAAIDNGGTRTQVIVREGDVKLGGAIYDTPRDYGTAILTLGLVASGLAEGRKLNAVGFALAGKVADDGNRIVSAGDLQAYGWVGKPFKDDVAEQFGIDSAAVVLMNDCVAAAKAQQVANRKAGDPNTGYIETISTGWGGAGFTTDELIADEPGHEFLREGALCGCGKDGCAEAHISGSGIFRKFGIRGEDLPEDKWVDIVRDTVDAHVLLLHRLEAMGIRANDLHFFGSVALGSAYLLPGLEAGLEANKDDLPFLPGIRLATHGNESGIVGAGDAALELVRS